MENIIFDTSIWIDFSNGKINKQSNLLAHTLENGANYSLIPPTVLQEFLMGLKEEKVFVNYLFLNIIKADWEFISIAAAKLYFDLRKKGVAIRKSTDCLIAQIAIQNNILLVHNDSDFELIASHSSLKTFKL
jgi:predicted nucleic acid-binding protein